MADLVDYLRDKLDHADNPPPSVELPGVLGYQFGPQVALWSDGRWACRECTMRGQTTPKTDVIAAAWNHLDAHRPEPKKRWWRR